jgi:hypothetical protein
MRVRPRTTKSSYLDTRDGSILVKACSNLINRALAWITNQYVIHSHGTDYGRSKVESSNRRMTGLHHYYSHAVQSSPSGEVSVYSQIIHARPNIVLPLTPAKNTQAPSIEYMLLRCHCMATQSKLYGSRQYHNYSVFLS